MQIRKLFDENLNPKWDYIWTLEPFKACIGVNQNKEWHREMLEEHIKKVTTNMHGLIEENRPDYLHLQENHHLMLMAAALCHDLGKATTTRWDNGLKQWKCKSHGAVGEKITRKLFFDEPDIVLRESVCWLVRYHMGLHNAKDADDDTINRKVSQLSNMWNTIDFDDVVALYICDCMGSDNDFNDAPNYAYMDNVAFGEKTLALHNQKYCYLKKSFDVNPSAPDVIIMCGISGSGKSTVASEYANKHGYQIISRDSIREKLGMTSADKKFKGSKKQEEKVTEVFNERMVHYAKFGIPFIIDNMNLIERYRNGYKELLKDYDLVWSCVYVEAPTLDECKKRREGQMPPGEIDKMLDRLEFPRPYEFNGNIYLYKQLQSEC